MTSTKSAGQLLQEISNDEGFRSEIVQVRANAALDELLEQPAPVNWTYIPARVLRNATGATQLLKNVALQNSEQRRAFEGIARQLAQTWEALARLDGDASRSTSLLNAAISYELAGYQANARCLARLLLPNPASVEEASVLDLAAMFIQRQFLRVTTLAPTLTAEPDEFADFGEAMTRGSVALLARGLASASDFFLNGNAEQLVAARDDLVAATEGFVDLSAAKEVNTTTGLRSLLGAMEDRSTWSLIGSYHQTPVWTRYLSLLARGVGASLLDSSSVSELWPSQIAALDNGLLGSSDSKVIRMPTSAGKTRIAELCVVDSVVRFPASKCIYVAPYRALVNEVEDEFARLLSDLGLRTTSIVGTYESSAIEEVALQEDDLLILTPERLDALLRVDPPWMDDVRLVVIDEGHLVADSQRGPKLELLVTRLKQRLPAARFLFMSAVVPQETLEEFARWPRASPDDVVVSRWRPSLQRMARLNWRAESGSGTLRYAPEDDFRLPEEFLPGLIRRQGIQYENPKTGRIKTLKFPTNKSQVAAALAFQFLSLGPVLVFCSQPNFAEAVGKAAFERVRIGRLAGEEWAGFDGRETVSATVAAEWLGEEHVVTALLREGIAVHHGRLPDPVRKAVERDFRSRRFALLVATNTLAQGVNLPVRTVIVHSCWRMVDPESTRRERISARDYWNIAGRAGRAGEETEGTIVHIVATAQDRLDYEYYRSQRELNEPLTSSLYEILQGLVERRITNEAVLEHLDADILALLVEEAFPLSNSQDAEAMLSASLVGVQAQARTQDTTRLAKLVADAVNDVRQRVSPSLLKTYSETGLSVKSCELLRQHVESNGEFIRTRLWRETLGELEDVCEFLLDALMPLDEMQSVREIPSDHTDLLVSWISGQDVGAIASSLSDDEVDLQSLSRFIEDVFSYRMPWGVAGYATIAKAVLVDPDDEEPAGMIVSLPAMMKFGVPVPEASWAMSAGIPTRSLAMQIAREFLAEELDGASEFRRWLGRQGIDGLGERFGIQGPLLYETARALLRHADNPYLRGYEGLDALLPWQVSVRPSRFAIDSGAIDRLVEDQSLLVVRDYGSVLDRNSVQIRDEDVLLGWLPRAVSQTVAPEIDAGVILSATLRGVAPGNEFNVRLDRKSSTQDGSGE
jgi:helicase